MSSKPKIQLDCPKCQAGLSIPVKKVGQSVVCPKCKRSFRVPSFEELSQVESPPEQKQPEQKQPEPSDESPELSFDDLDSSLFDNVDQLIEQHKQSAAQTAKAEPNSSSDSQSDPQNESLETEESDEEEQPGVMDYEEEFSLESHLDSPELQLGSASAVAELTEGHSDSEFSTVVGDASKVQPHEEVEEEEEENLTSLPFEVGDSAFSSSTSAEIYAIMCKVCDSRVQVTVRNKGETIDCPECFTKLYVHGPTKADRERMEKAKQKETEYELAPPAPRPKPVAEGHGLEAETRDLLSPPSRDSLNEGAASADENLSETGSSNEPVKGRSTSGNSTPAKESGNSEPAPKSKAKKKKKKKYGSKAYWEAKVAEADVGKKVPEILTQKQMGPRDYVKWGIKSLRSPDLIARSLIGIVALGFAYWMSDIFHFSMNNSGLKYHERVTGVAFPILLGGAALLVAVMMLATTLSLVFQNSASGVSFQEEWPGFSLSDWWGPVTFFLFSFWLASIPGAFVGLMLALATDLNVFVLLVGSLSAFLLAPPLYMSACYNGSPFQVFSKEVVKTFSTDNVDWLRFTPLAFGAWLVFAAGVGIVILPWFVFAFSGAAIQVVALAVYASVIGLFCGRYVTRLL